MTGTLVRIDQQWVLLHRLHKRQPRHRRVGISCHGFCILTPLLSDGYHRLGIRSIYLRYGLQSMFVSQMGYLEQGETIRCRLAQSLRFGSVKIGLAFLL